MSPLARLRGWADRHPGIVVVAVVVLAVGLGAVGAYLDAKSLRRGDPARPPTCQPPACLQVQLPDREPGDYDLVLELPDGGSVPFRRAFAVKDAGGPK